MTTLIPKYDIKNGATTPTGAINRPISEKLNEYVSIKDFGAICDGTTDDTVACQNAINYASSINQTVLFVGNTVLVSSLSLPSNTILELGTTTLLRKAATNLPLLVNSTINYTAYTYNNTNIQINGGILDFNGANQSDTNSSDGSWVVGVKFVGVDTLLFNQTQFKNTRRFNVFICNCTRIRAYGTEIYNNTSIASTNQDGYHINGNTQDFYADVIKVYNSEDDAVALNANDIDFGGDMIPSNIDGPIDDINIGELNCISSANGLRLLSATWRIRNVYIGSITGDVSAYAMQTGDYGLGTSSWYQNIRIGTIDVVFAPTTGTAFGMVNINTPNNTDSADSSFFIDTIYRYQNADSGQGRNTVTYNPKRTTLEIGLINEYSCSNLYTVEVTGAGAGTNLTINRVEKTSSRPDPTTGFYGTAVYLIGNLSGVVIDLISVQQIQCDYLRNSILLSAANVNVLDVEVLTPTNIGEITIFTSTINVLFWKSYNSNSYLNSSYRYILEDGTSQVLFERPAPVSGTTSQLPVNPITGDRFYNITTSTSVVWNGSSWV